MHYKTLSIKAAMALLADGLCLACNASKASCEVIENV